MKFDIIMPSVIFFLTLIIIFLHSRYHQKFKTLLEEKELRVRDIILLVALMGIMVTLIAYIPDKALLILFLTSYSAVMFLFLYIATKRWHIAILLPALFIALYVFYWNEITINIFGALFAIFITVYIGTLFTWRTTLIFAGLITIMDIIQVLITGFMGASAEKLLTLQLPVLIILPSFPAGGTIGLGLGDFFLAGLLNIHTTQKYGKKLGIFSVAATSLGFLIGEIILINYVHLQYFPATVLILLGWLISFSFIFFYFRRKQNMEKAANFS